MKFDRLQTLAEGDEASRDHMSFLADTRRFMTDLESKLYAAEKLVEGNVLKTLLKRGGFPATEANDLKKTFKNTMDQFMELQQSMTSVKAELSEQSEYEREKKEERAIRRVVGSIESKLPYDCQYKQWDTNKSTRKIDWVTQGSSEAQSMSTAEIIVKALRKAGLAAGWKVRVTVRDGYKGDKTNWHAQVEV